MMGLVKLGAEAFGAANLLSKLAVLGGILLALIAAYGVWHHQVYQSGYDAALADVAKADTKAVKRATEFRNQYRSCRDSGRQWDQSTGKCS